MCPSTKAQWVCRDEIWMSTKNALTQHNRFDNVLRCSCAGQSAEAMVPRAIRSVDTRRPVRGVRGHRQSRRSGGHHQQTKADQQSGMFCAFKLFQSNENNTNRIWIGFSYTKSDINLLSFGRPDRAGAHLSGALSTAVLPAGHRGQHENGLLQSGHGLCTELLALHVARSEGDHGERAQGDGLYAHANHQHGHRLCGRHDLVAGSVDRALVSRALISVQSANQTDTHTQPAAILYFIAANAYILLIQFFFCYHLWRFIHYHIYL